MKTKILIHSSLIAAGIASFAFTGILPEKNSDSAAVRETVSLATTPLQSEKLPAELSENTVQVALLLDTSNSMDGLIEQAKSRLWNIVNTLSTLKFEGKTPRIEIALYEYGNDGLDQKHWVRKVTPLTQDLDLISEKLFSLRTNGGTEYCGAVIKDAVSALDWNGNSKAMKLIYIAGNEAFNQEGVNYKTAISAAREQQIFVNTIFCGNRREGIETHWQDAAQRGGGQYFNIDSDRKVIFIETPYDIRISELNSKLNDTYVSYGRMGEMKKMSQHREDANAASYSRANAVERSISKSKKEAYRADSWDLVDKVERDKNYIQQMKAEDIPAEMKGKSKEEIAKIIETKSRERSKIQKDIADLASQRQAYMDSELKKRGENTGDDLGKAIEKSIHELAKVKGFSF